MRNVLIITLLVFSRSFLQLTSQVSAQTTTPFDFILPLTENVSSDSLARTILDLQGFVSRFSINENRIEIAQYLKNRLERYGCEVYLDTFVMISPYDGRSLLQYNVIGKIPGDSLSDAVLMGAHYDACCRADSSPGADDNASGVAVVVEAARIFASQNYEPRKTVYFCAWAAEEQGLLGSRDFANKLKFTNQKLALAINLDMVANSPDSLLKVTFESSPSVTVLAKYLSLLNGALSVEEGPATSNSDHASFRGAGFPIVYYHEYSFSSYYHTAKDQFVNLNMFYCKRIAQAAISTLIGFSALPTTPTFIYAGNSGTGNGVSLAWNRIPNINRFRVELIGNNAALLNTLIENQYSFVTEGLSVGSITANLYSVDPNGIESIPVSRNIILSNRPDAILNFVATSDASKISLTWEQPSELDLQNILILQRPYFSTIPFDTIARIAPTVNSFEIYPENSEPLAFKIISVDSAGNYGYSSPIRATALAHYNRGLLVVLDATSNPYGLSADTIRGFFSALNEVIPTTILSASTDMPDIYNAYRMVLWHSTVAGLSQKLASQVSGLGRFMNGGGALVVSTDYPQKLLNSANNSSQTFYPIDPVSGFLQIQQTNYISGSLMQSAIGQHGFPTIRVDSTKVTSNNGQLNNFCELKPSAPLTSIYSAFTNGSGNAMNGKSVGYFSQDNPALMVLAFPLAFMVYEDVKQLISHLINNVYQGIEEVDFNDFCSAELFPNPVSEYLTVRFISKESISKVKIFSVMGELKGEYSFRTPSPWEMYQFSIQVNDLPEGIYVLLLENKAYLFVRRND